MSVTLVILAAGMGSRFKGSLKQLAKINENNDTIMELSIKNAKKAGFNKVVFIIREELKEDFLKQIIPRIDMDYSFAYQKVDKNRTKPWGTGEAILNIEGLVSDKFCLINSDDYYSYEALKEVYDFLSNSSDNMLVGYKLKNTIFTNQPVNRGICNVEDNKLISIEEKFNIKRLNDSYIADTILDPNTLTSMNLWGFNSNILALFKEEFKLFVENIKDYKTDEFLITEVINKLIKGKKINVFVKETESLSIGVTYSEDVSLFNKIINS